MKSRHGLFALWAVLLAAGMALIPLGSAQAQQRGGNFVYMIPASGAPSLDGHRETTYATVHATAPFYSLLIRLDPTDKDGKRIVGDLATSWDVSKDGKTYTFHLHHGVTFHDGTPLTSKDVVTNFEYIMNPPQGVLSPRKAYYLMVDSVSAPDKYTVVFKLKFPTAAFIPAVAMPFNYIYPGDKLKSDPHWFEQHVLGSGPFQFVEYEPGAKVVGKRYPKYYVKGRPYLDSIEGIYAAKQNVYVDAIRGGRAMSMFRGLPPKAVEELKKAMGDQIRVQESPWNCGLLWAVNVHKKPFDDVRVRRALNLAVDRWGGSRYLSQIAIVKTVAGIVFPTSDLAPSRAQLETLEGYWPDVKKSRAKARELLKEAGVPEGFTIEFNNRNTDQPYKVVGTWLIDQWRQVGLNVKQHVQPTAPFFAELRSNPQKFDLSMDFNCQSIVNPTVDVSQFISGDKTPNNHSRYIDRKLDDLYDAQLHEANHAKQKELLWEMQKRLIEQAWYPQTMWWHRIVVSNTKMHDWNITPSHYLNMQLDDVWLSQ
ncbi:MAG TPA: ABC transporter substrate-binding protein [bacterium]|nr:ABC transporter substrate-binding protein [bacterium]